MGVDERPGEPRWFGCGWVFRGQRISGHEELLRFQHRGSLRLETGAPDLPGFLGLSPCDGVGLRPDRLSLRVPHPARLFQRWCRIPLELPRNNALLYMHQYNIDGLLSSTPYQHSGYPQAFDGSLWTLIYEFKCYIGVAVVGTLGLMWRARISVVVIALFFWVAQLQDPCARLGSTVGHSLRPEYGPSAFIFSIGMLFYLYRDKVPMSNTLAVVAPWCSSSHEDRSLVGVGQVAWAYLVLWLAIRLPIVEVRQHGDFSYGMYIYAFPVEQLLALYGVYRWGYVPM